MTSSDSGYGFLSELAGVRQFPPMSGIEEKLAALRVTLPPAHRALLAVSDGLTSYGGYFRIFGLGGAVQSLEHWNHPETWTFAWPAGVRAFFFFGETAWGDQYGYLLDDIRSGAEATVYFMDANLLSPEPIASTFSEFFTDEFVRNCKQPYDERTLDARATIGDLQPHEHVVFVPSVLVSGEESMECAKKMPARAAMIVGGDLAVQLVGESASRPIERLEPYEDERGRTRLRVIWR